MTWSLGQSRRASTFVAPLGAYDGGMSQDDMLFGETEPAQADPLDPASVPISGIADWQVAQVRRALDARGVQKMQDRQQLIVRLVGRPVDSLRDLTSSEALSLLQQLARSAPTTAGGGSSWDDRDEDTWIDRL